MQLDKSQSKERKDARPVLRVDLQRARMIHVLQSTMRWEAIAHTLLAQFAAEVKGDLVVISEQSENMVPPSRHLDLSAILV